MAEPQERPDKGLPEAPPRPPSNSTTIEYLKLLRETALKLYKAGYNIVIVDCDKKPLTSWSSEKRVSEKDLRKLLEDPRACGLAIIGGPINPFDIDKNGNPRDINYLMLIDIDDPRVLDKTFYLKYLFEKSVSYKTGPRCPRCFNKHLDVIEPGKRFRCSKCDIEFNIDESPRGVGIIVSVDKTLLEKNRLKGSLRQGSVELLINNYQLIPPSKHRTGVLYEWINEINLELPNHRIYSLLDIELETLLKEIGYLKDKEVIEEKIERKEASEKIIEKKIEKPRGKLRRLTNDEKLKIFEALKEAYKPGYRQYIWLFLSGWGAIAKIDPLDIGEVLKMLYDTTGDSDNIKTRASAIVYSYKKAGIDLDEYESDFENLFGVKPYGLEKEINEEWVKGRTGIQEVLEETVEEEKALAIIDELNKIFQKASPFRDSIIEILDYEKQLYAIANLRKLTTVRGRRENDKQGARLVYKERVFIGAPTEVTVYINPIGGITKYKVRWETPTRPRPLIIGPAMLDEIVDRLKAEGLVTSSRLAYDVMAAIVEGFIRRGKALIKEEIEAPGFYIVDGKLIATNIDIEKPDKDDVKQAIEILNGLGEKWFSHAQDRFSRVFRWGVISPFIYAYKQMGKWVKWKYLYGASKTGKTTLGEIAVIYLWGLDETKHKKPGSSIDTVARLGHVLSQSTFPTLVNEPGGVFMKEELVDMIKSGIESTTARGKYYRGNYIEIPSLSPLLFTSNRTLPKDDALLRKLDIERFTFGEKIDLEKEKAFEKEMKPRLKKLKALGDFIAWYILNSGLKEDPWKMAVEVLEEAYKYVYMKMPEWLYPSQEEEYRASEEFLYEDIRETIRNYFIKRINEEFNRFVGRIVVEKSEGLNYRYEYRDRKETDLKDRLMIVLQYNLIPWMMHRQDREGRIDIIITTGLIDELTPIIGDIGGLKSIAELLGWEYNPKCSFRIKGKVKNINIIRTNLNDFLEFLSPKIDQE
jgi:hypothetical protein